MNKVAVGIVGTAKNTGKTTATVALLDSFYREDTCLGLTSIGFDGELVDNITGLPKPRLFVRKGIIVATAEKCLKSSTAKIKNRKVLDIETSLGKIVCGKVEQEGLIVLAGPNRSSYLRKIKHYLYEYGADLILVDGALNRISPMTETDGFILATGAALSQNNDKVALHARYLSTVCNVPGQVALPEQIANLQKTVMWNNRNGEVLATGAASIFKPDQLAHFKDLAGKNMSFYCPGLVMGSCLKEIMGSFPLHMHFVFSDPSKLIVSNELEKVDDFVQAVVKNGGNISYLYPMPLLAVTVNPFYPSYRYGTKDYRPAYVDKNKLLNSVAESVNVPVFNIVEYGCDNLARLLKKFAAIDK